MSLLMDALHKAEKERSKVVSESDAPQRAQEHSATEPPFSGGVEIFETDATYDEPEPKHKEIPASQHDLDVLSLLDKELRIKEEQNGNDRSADGDYRGLDRPNRKPAAVEAATDQTRQESHPETHAASKATDEKTYNIPVLGVAKKKSKRNSLFVISGLLLSSLLIAGYLYIKSFEDSNGNSISVGAVSTRQIPVDSSLEQSTIKEGTGIDSKEQTVEVESPDIRQTDSKVEPKPQVTQKAVPEAKSEKTGQAPAVAKVLPEDKKVMEVQLEVSPIDHLQQKLQQAYLAYRAGEMHSAREYYQAALQYEPDNRDALLGVAVTSQQQGDNEHARLYYKKLLELHPKDSMALAGLISIEQGLDENASESRLKLLLEEKPQAAYLHAALGAKYVAQRRWPEAQQAFFKAYHYDPANPDYAYNLAVSLDHLGQFRVAMEYYEQALELSRGIRAKFKKTDIESRLLTLSLLVEKQ